MSGPDRWSLDTLHEHVLTVIASNDKRYEQRFDASQKAIELGFSAQKSAVDAALAAADRAVIKAELAAEKRFECVSIDTPILCADLTWRPAGDLVAGDELLAFDEESPSRRGRLFRKAVVTANSHQEDDLLLVKTPDGEVRCNAKHPWLVRRPRSTRSGIANGIWAWVRTSDLKIGDEVMKAMDTWEVDRSWESGWLAGMLDGEGCLCLNKNGGAQLSIAQRESLTSTRIGDVLRSRVASFVTFRQEAGTRSTVRNTCAFFHFVVSARSDILKILGSVRSPRLIGKASGVWEGKPLGGKNRRTVVASIEHVGRGMIAALSTSTRTYLAGGFAMHNSVNEFRATLSDQQRNLIPRSEVEVTVRGLTEKITTLQNQVERMQAERVGGRGAWGYMVGAAGLIVAIAALVLRLFSR